ncbi:AraC family transcriptional regulator [Curvibacter sp. HBC61]|uniref:AraC family transcriptional regulator n=1 Tax=Curvibacter cyanobacteriorum TaxID=3026422 RepID=A0ABT5MZJ3_9BURK|nr:AraC family transcriptional regulator [Curvibacter sp. HBC61]MDD0839487.1 AraC family transcriptional regulator [Curvibacter sp. HBC61]
MLPTPSLLGAPTRLYLPRPSLVACVRGTMVRSTLGLDWADEQRFNHFPATPLCSLGWWFEGTGELLARGAPAALHSPRRPYGSRLVFGGPQTGPSITWNPGPAHGMMVMLMPDALQSLTGLDVAAWVDRIGDLREALPADWVAMAEAVLAQPDDARRVACVEDFLEPRWQAVRPQRPLQAQRYQDWAQSMALRAATSSVGRSLRQVERRIKHWAGQPLRELRGFGRSEQVFFQALAEADEGQRPRWAELAEATGYADQSHLCRETRRITGFAPQELMQRMTHDEGFWSYRLWQ